MTGFFSRNKSPPKQIKIGIRNCNIFVKMYVSIGYYKSSQNIHECSGYHQIAARGCIKLAKMKLSMLFLGHAFDAPLPWTFLGFLHLGHLVSSVRLDQ